MMHRLKVLEQIVHMYYIIMQGRPVILLKSDITNKSCVVLFCIYINLFPYLDL